MIVVSVILYLVLILLKLDTIDRKALILSIQCHNRFIGVPLGITRILDFITRILVIPFKDSLYFAKCTEGGLYGAFFFSKYPKLTKDMDSKVYWWQKFNQRSIQCPQVYAYTINNKPTLVNTIHEDRMYVTKPINGGLGIDVYKLKGKDALRLIQTRNNVLVQEYLKDCNTKHIRHFRLVTLHDGTLFTGYKLETKNKNTIASNHANGGEVSSYKSLECIDEQSKLNEMIRQLRTLHHEEYNMIFSIGWDVMFHCDNDDNITAYALEGNVGHSCWFWPGDIDDNIVLDYKSKLGNFLDNVYFTL